MSLPLTPFVPSLAPRIALLGSGAALDALINLMRDTQAARWFSEVGFRILAWLPLMERDDGVRPPLSIPCYNDWASLAASHPQLNVACDLSDDGAGMRILREQASNDLTLLTAGMFQRWCATISAAQPWLGAEVRLQADRAVFDGLLDQLEEEVMIADRSGLILVVNRQVPKAWGGCKEDYVGKNYCELGNPELYGAEQQPFIAMVLGSGKKITEHYSDVNSDGRVRHYQVHTFPFCSPGGDVQRVVMTRRDITERVEMEQRLQTSQKLAVVGELASYVAHEIRNPLFAIGGFAQRLRNEPNLSDSVRAKIQVIFDESQRLERILKTLLAFSKPSDDTQLDVNANEEIEQAVEYARAGNPDGVTIKTELSPELPKIYGSAEELRQGLLNLIKNAQEAVAPGGTIVVRSRYANATVYLEVEDNGSGIPVGLQDQVFKPFFTTKENGSGLGLPLTRKLIAGMGGHLLIHSRPGLGSLFTITLSPAFAEGPGGPKLS